MLAMAIVAIAAMPAAAASVDPTLVPGNPKLCEGGLKIDPVPLGESTHEWTVEDSEGNDVPVSVMINVYSTSMGQMMDFTVTGGVAFKVVAKGGRYGAYVYDYTPDGVASDSGIHTPINPSGKYADFSHIDFCFGTGDTTTEILGALSGRKWYDLNMNGVFDPLTEDGLAGWRIILSKWDMAQEMWVERAMTLTGPGGAYTFAELEAGVYKVEEGAASGMWKQTWPVDPNFYAGIAIGGADSVEELDFGNVCMRGGAKGYTMGFWSNKNGLAAMKAFVSGGGNLPGGMTPAQIQTYFGKAANAQDMCVMLRAQYLAHQLNKMVPVNGKTANYAGAGIMMNGQVKSYDAIMACFGRFDCATGTRAKAEWFKNVFDGLNNNRYTLVEYSAPAVPIW